MEAVQRGRRVGRAPRRVVVLLVVAAPLVAAALAELTWDGEGRLLPAMWFLAAVISTALAGGLAPGLVTVGTSTLLLLLLFTQPRLSLVPDEQAELSGLVGFVVAGLLICLLLDHLQTSRIAAEEAIDERDRSLALLDDLLATAPVGLGFLDLDLRFVRANDALAAIDGLPVQDHVGLDLAAALGLSGSGDLDRLLEAAGGGRRVLDLPVSGRRRGSGEPLALTVGTYPIRLEGGLTGVGLVVRDVTLAARTESDRAALFERLARIQAVTAGLSGAASLDDMVAVVLDQGRRALGATAASLATRVGDALVVHIEQQGERVSTEELDPDNDDPHSIVIRTGEPLLLGDRAEVDVRFPDVEDVQALAVLPLISDGRVRGAIDVGFDGPRDFDSGERAFLAAVAGVCAAALDRARLFESERTARSEAEDATGRVAFLAEASAAFVALDWERTLGSLADLAVPRLADWCAVVLAEGRDLRALRVAHVDPARAVALRRLVQEVPLDAGGPEGLQRVLSEGRPVVLPEVTPEVLRSYARDGGHLALLEAVGVCSLLVTPLVVQGEVLGAITLGSSGDRRFGDADVALASEVATRAGQAIVNSRLLEQRSHIAATLQASLVPRLVTDVPGLELAARFVAGGEGVDVGGDFYDAFPLDDGRWAVAIGDVRGKGVEAAVLTATARNTIRSISVIERSPARMLEHLNEVLVRSGGDDEPRFCTVALATITPGEGGAAACLAVAGHPLPYVLRADGSTRQVGVPGTLLGVLPRIDVQDVDVTLGRSEALVLFTDGVTERHDGSRFFDEAALSSVLSRCAGFTAEALAERVETAARAYVEDLRRDDLALLVLRVPERVATSAGASTELPATVESAARARRFVRAALEPLPSPVALDVAELLTSELVTNAVLHGGSAIRVSVAVRRGVVRVSVSDASARPPELRSPSLTDEHGRGMTLIEAMATRWGVDVEETGKTVWFELA